MLTTLTPARLTQSLLAVPPHARNPHLSLNEPENAKIIPHIESGGVTTLLYGGNANFYHLPLSEYDATLSMLAKLAAADTLVIPSAGPAFGLSLDQAKLLRQGGHKFPTVMLLPQVGITTSKGVADGVKRFADAAGLPALLYIKHDGYIDPADVEPLASDGTISGIKYATVRHDPAVDPYLTQLLDHVDPGLIISGIGEQPAIVHMKDFGLAGFTTGCGCVAPRLSAATLAAIRAGNWSKAERLRTIFKPLEDLRNAINPIRVLHESLRLSGIADTGPLMPLLTNLEEKDHFRVAEAAKHLLATDRA
jgi:dihydrodipicolinate synthase/N-acetylneuraminate lyase